MGTIIIKNMSCLKDAVAMEMVREWRDELYSIFELDKKTYGVRVRIDENSITGVDTYIFTDQDIVVAKKEARA